LLTDNHLSIDSIARLQEAIVNHELPVSDTEHETVAQRLRREGFADGERAGERKGERRGERKGREALLAVAAELVPDRVAELARIKGLTDLRAAVVAIVRGAK
jgi:flagellar biosynthesis/type III secretory pathway protein FliH